MHKLISIFNIRFIVFAMIILAVINMPIYAGKKNTVIDGSAPKSALEMHDEESRKTFMLLRQKLHAKEYILATQVEINTDALIYDMHREIVAEIMFRFDTQSKIIEVITKKKLIQESIQNENSEYASILVKLQNIEEELVARGIEVNSAVLENVDDEIGIVKRKLTREALKKILDYEKQKRGDIIQEILHDKSDVIVRNEKDKIKREILLEIVQLGGASDKLKALIADPTRSLDEVKEQVANELGDDTYNQKVNQLQELAVERRHIIIKQYEMEKIAYEKLKRKVAELSVVVDRNKLIISATSKQLLRMARREYRNALIHYTEGSYRIAAIKIETILKDYASFNDKSTALFVLAESQLALNMYNDAEENYKELLLDYVESEFSGMALYRLVDMAYLFGDYIKIIDYAEQFVFDIADSSIKSGIAYMVGRSYYFLKEYGKSQEYFAMVTDGYDYVPAALYMQSLCLIKTDSLQNAIPVLKKCMKVAQPNVLLDQSILQLYDDANIALGHIYFKLKRYDDALIAYGRVDNQSLRYQDVLLGKLWVAFSLEEYDRVVVHATRLLGRYMSSDFYYEVMVMKGIALSKLRLYKDAAKTYEQIIGIQDGIDLLREYSLTQMALDQLQSHIATIEQNSVTDADTTQFLSIRRISRGVSQNKLKLKKSKDYVRMLFSVEEKNITIETMKSILAEITHSLAQTVTHISHISKGMRGVLDHAKIEKSDRLITEAEIENQKTFVLVSQLHGIEAELKQINITTRNSSLQRAVERSECGKLDIEFAQQQESKSRIKDIRAINQSINAILNEVENGTQAK